MTPTFPRDGVSGHAGAIHDTLGLGLESVEGKQKLVGKSGMKWEIDGKGVKTEDGAIVVIECRRYPKDKVEAEEMGRFRGTGSVTLALQAGSS